MREAIITFDDDELADIGFAGLVSAVRDAGIRDVEMLEDDGYTCVPQVEVEERLDPDELEEFECVDDCEFVAEREDTFLYILELTASALPEGITDDHDELLGNCETSVTERGVLLSLVGSQEAIRDVLRNYEAVGTTPDLCKLAEYEGKRDALDALTDRQLEVLETAYELGFYDVPREATIEDVATAIELDETTVSEHLQRAERNLLTQQLAT